MNSALDLLSTRRIQLALRAPGVADLAGDRGEVGSVRESERREIVLLDRLEAGFALPAFAVRHPEAHAVGRIVAVKSFGVGLLVPRGSLDHAILAEARVEIAEIDAGERVVDIGIGIAARDDERRCSTPRARWLPGRPTKRSTDSGPVAESWRTPSTPILSGPARPVSLTPASSVSASPFVVEADAAREERDAALPLEPAELEDVRVLQEERALLREEEVEARQVDLARVRRRAGEIRVQRQRRGQRRRDLPERVERWLEELVLLVRRVVTRRRRREGPG